MLDRIALIRLELHEYDGSTLRAMSSFPAFLNALASHVDRLSLVLPVRTTAIRGRCHDLQRSGLGYRLRPRDSLLKLPDVTGYFRTCAALPLVVLQLIRLRARGRVVICRAPEHGNLFVLPLVRLLGFTPVIWIVSDRDEVAYAYEVRRRNGFRMVAGRILGRIIGAVENHFVRRCAVVANGEELSRKARQLKVTNTDQVLPVISTTLSAVNIVGKTGQRPADGTKELLYVGRLAPEKGLYDLLPAFRQLLDHHEQKLRLRLVGWGAAGEEGRLRLEAERLGLTSLVSFQGLVPHGPELFSYYRRAEIFVLPSRAEGTPRVLVEAMAHGLPIVATDVGGIPSMVRSGENALLVPPGRPAALVEALDRLLRDPFLVARMSDANVKRARDYTVEGLARRMAGFLADRIPEGVAGKIA